MSSQLKVVRSKLPTASVADSVKLGSTGLLLSRVILHNTIFDVPFRDRNRIATTPLTTTLITPYRIPYI